MDTAMRDLELIRESDQEPSSRRFAVVAMAGGATAALVLSIGVLLHGAAQQTSAAPERDPLEALAAAERLRFAASEPETDPAEETTEVDPAELTFPTTLDAHDESAEPVGNPVEAAAAVAAAAAEYEHFEPMQGPSESLPPERAGAALPAAVAASTPRFSLDRDAAHDPLMAKVINERHAQDAAPIGHDGQYTLQVISYRSPEEARDFARLLRTRGHRAFVTSADIPGRGVHWRVRIGPFPSARHAEKYRAEFETSEQMNTYVVRSSDH